MFLYLLNTLYSGGPGLPGEGDIVITLNPLRGVSVGHLRALFPATT